MVLRLESEEPASVLVVLLVRRSFSAFDAVVATFEVVRTEFFLTMLFTSFPGGKGRDGRLRVAGCYI